MAKSGKGIYPSIHPLKDEQDRKKRKKTRSRPPTNPQHSPDAERLAVLDRAWALGATLWDTSAAYGDSEDLVGTWLRLHPARRADIFLCTKFGVGWREDPETGAIAFSVDTSPAACRASCERSLHRLGVESIDLFYVHRFDRRTPVEETMGALVELKKYVVASGCRFRVSLVLLPFLLLLLVLLLVGVRPAVLLLSSSFSPLPPPPSQSTTAYSTSTLTRAFSPPSPAHNREGKIKHIGFSECSSATLRRGHAVHPITAVQVEYNPWTLDIEGPAGTDLLATCRELGVAIVAYSPLGRGFITGRLVRRMSPSIICSSIHLIHNPLPIAPTPTPTHSLTHALRPLSLTPKLK